MASLVERFNLVAMTKASPMETIEMDKKYPLLMVSNDEDRRGARVALSLTLGDNTLGRLYMPPEFTPVFTLSDIWNINNDRVKYVLSVVRIDAEHPRNLKLELAEQVQCGWSRINGVFLKLYVLC